MNPAVKNYLIFSAAIAFVIALIINFGLLANFRSTFIYGFPISLEGTEGLGSFIVNLINTLIATLFFTPAVYYAIKWLQTRGGSF